MPGTTNTVYSRLPILNDKYYNQPPTERVESFDITNTYNAPAMTTVFPASYNPTTKNLKIA